MGKGKPRKAQAAPMAVARVGKVLFDAPPGKSENGALAAIPAASTPFLSDLLINIF